MIVFKELLVTLRAKNVGRLTLSWQYRGYGLLFCRLI